MGCWATIKEESEFFEIFGNESVQIRSIVPIIPREEGAPPCYIVLASGLTDEQLEKLANRLLSAWASECKSLDEAKEYIANGLPIKTTHFSGVTTNDYFHMPYGAALNIAIRAKYENSSI